MPWVKGQSGNPGGRPPQALATFTRQFTPEAVEGILAIARNKRVPAQTRLAAWNDILDRAWGKPTQTVAGDPDNPLRNVTEVRVVIVDKPTIEADVVDVPLLEAAE